MKPEDLETPDFDGRQFSSGEAQDEWPSRAHGWALILVLSFAIVGFSSWQAGSIMTAAVFFALTAGASVLAALTIRKELRKYMRYRRRL